MNRTCQVSEMNQKIMGLTLSRNVGALNNKLFSISAPASPLHRRSGHVDGVAHCEEARTSGSLWRVSSRSTQSGIWPGKRCTGGVIA